MLLLKIVNLVTFLLAPFIFMLKQQNLYKIWTFSMHPNCWKFSLLSKYSLKGLSHILKGIKSTCTIVPVGTVLCNNLKKI